MFENIIQFFKRVMMQPINFIKNSKKILFDDKDATVLDKATVVISLVFRTVVPYLTGGIINVLFLNAIYSLYYSIGYTIGEIFSKKILKKSFNKETIEKMKNAVNNNKMEEELA